MKRWIYVGPIHDVIDENLKDSRYRIYDFLHLEGRERCCKRPDLIEYIKKGYDIQTFCDECPQVDGPCIYRSNEKRAYKELPNLAITHAHINTWLKKFLNSKYNDRPIHEYYDVIIIDENPIKSFMQEQSINRKELYYIKECMLLGHFDKRITDLMDIICNTPINYNKLMIYTELKLQPLAISRSFSRLMTKLKTDGEIADLPKNIIPFLLDVINIAVEDKIKYMIYYDNGILNMSYFTPHALNFHGIKLIGLDGTANKIVWDHMLGTDVNIMRIDYEYYNIYQLDGPRYPIMSWKLSEKGKYPISAKIAGFLDKVAATRKRGVLVCTTKSVKAMLRKKVHSDKIEYAPLYNLRSRNSFWETCDTVILVCEPNIKPERIDACMHLSGWSSEVWQLIYREEEMLQAIGRIRQNIHFLPDKKTPREETQVIILPSTGVAKTADKLGKYSNLLPEARITTWDGIEQIVDGNFKYVEHYDQLQVIIDSCPISMKDLISQTKLGKQKIRSIMLDLENRGLVINERGRFRLTTEGTIKISMRERIRRGWIKETNSCCGK